jgi:hypothetical protein
MNSSPPYTLIMCIQIHYTVYFFTQGRGEEGGSRVNSLQSRSKYQNDSLHLQSINSIKSPVKTTLGFVCSLLVTSVVTLSEKSPPPPEEKPVSGGAAASCLYVPEIRAGMYHDSTVEE